MYSVFWFIVIVIKYNKSLINIMYIYLYWGFVGIVSNMY